MDRRPSLHELLKALFNGEHHVYFQPPKNTILKYPCIIYKLAGIQARHADNRHYIQKREYELTVIDRDPDSALREKVVSAMCGDFPVPPDQDEEQNIQAPCGILNGRFVRFYTAENLNHYVFRILY